MASKQAWRTDVCIIGAGASGAAAAKVLSEAGVKVVALEKGPWRTRESFGGDELANINRYNLWPDPLLNPRTGARPKPTSGASGECSARCRRWSAAARSTGRAGCRASRQNDFRLRTVAGDLPGTTLADWPITYDELEPYYVKVEWAFGVSGQAGANKFEGPRRRLSLPADADVALRAEVPQGLRARSAGTRSRRRRRRSVAPLQRPQGRR